MLDYINVNRYEDICDLSIVPGENKLFTTEFLKRNAIIFCKTDFIQPLFMNLKFSIFLLFITSFRSPFQ